MASPRAALSPATFIFVMGILITGIPCGAVADTPIAATSGEIEAFVQADRNGDTVLTPLEFRIFVDAMAGQGQSTARMIRFFGAYEYAFSVADADGDGRVVPQELRDADDGYRAGSD